MIKVVTKEKNTLYVSYKVSITRYPLFNTYMWAHRNMEKANEMKVLVLLLI